MFVAAIDDVHHGQALVQGMVVGSTYFLFTINSRIPAHKADRVYPSTRGLGLLSSRRITHQPHAIPGRPTATLHMKHNLPNALYAS